MVVLNPKHWGQENPRFDEEDVKSSCDTIYLNKQETHLGYIEYKACNNDP